MRRNRLWLLSILTLTVGCTNRQQTVFVDLGAAIGAEKIPAITSPESPKPPQALAAQSFSMPPVPAQTVNVGSTQKRLEQIEEVIKRNRQDAEKEIGSRLRESYLAEVDRSEKEKILALEPIKKKAIEAAYAKVRVVFDAYALKRGQALVKLSLLAGFPDVDPTSARKPSETAAQRFKTRYATMKDLRDQIAKLDAEYAKDSQALMGEVDTSYSADLTKIRLEIDDLRRQAEERAQADAANQVQKEQEQLHSVLEDKTQVSFPAEPGKTVTVKGAAQLAPAPKVVLPSIEDARRQMEHAVESDLLIWAGLNKFNVVRKKDGARDATTEFIEWRRNHLAGH